MSGTNPGARRHRVGLIAGLAPPATGERYDHLADLLDRHGHPAAVERIQADYGRAIGHARSSDMPGLAQYLRSLIERLAEAGAGFAVVAGVTPHNCAPDLRAISPIPLIDIVDVLRARLEDASVRRLALLSTPVVMASRMFGRLADFDVIELTATEIEAVNRIHAGFVHTGTPSKADKNWLTQLGRDLHTTRGAEVIVLGGTELSLLLNEKEAPFPVIDCIEAHLQTIVRHATGASPGPPR